MELYLGIFYATFFLQGCVARQIDVCLAKDMSVLWISPLAQTIRRRTLPGGARLVYDGAKKVYVDRLSLDVWAMEYDSTVWWFENKDKQRVAMNMGKWSETIQRDLYLVTDSFLMV
jgi:hypothetical protein